MLLLQLDRKVRLELLVLEGSFTEQGEEFEKGSWLRLPKGMASQAMTSGKGARVWDADGNEYPEEQSSSDEEQ